MLDQLPALARSLGREATCSKLLPEMMDLAGDEEAVVRCSALAALSSIAQLLTPGLPSPLLSAAMGKCDRPCAACHTDRARCSSAA